MKSVDKLSEKIVWSEASVKGVSCECECEYECSVSVSVRGKEKGVVDVKVYE